MKGKRVEMTEKWWRKKWYWMLCILLPLLLGPAIKLFFFPEMPLSRSLVYAIASSVGVLLAYFAVMRKPILNIQPKALRRIIFICVRRLHRGGSLMGFHVLPLVSYFDIPGPIIIFLLFLLMVICAFIVDTIMKRRGHRPFMERGGNI